MYLLLKPDQKAVDYPRTIIDYSELFENQLITSRVKF